MYSKNIWLAGSAIFIITFTLFSFSLNGQFIDLGGYGGMDYSAWSKNPFICHLSSVILHSVNAFLFFVFSFMFFDRTELNHDGKNPAGVIVPAAFSALFFAAHPLRAEAVAWISFHSVVLSVFFCLLCFLSYFTYAENRQISSKKRKFYVFSVILCFLAVLTNIIAAAIPFLLLLLDYFPLRRLNFSGNQAIKRFLSENNQQLKEKIPFLAIAAIALIIYLSTSHIPFHGLSIAKIIYLYGFYLIKTAFPFGLVPVYQMPQNVLLPDIIFIAAICSFGAVSWHFRHKNPLFLYAFLYYIIALMPASVLTAGDRYSYLPMLSFALLFGYAGGKMALSLKKGRKFAYAAFSSIPLLFAGISFFQQKAWADSETLWLHELEYYKNCDIAWSGLANKQYGNENYGLALMYITKAIELNPSHFPYKCDAAKIHLAMGNHETAFSLFSSAIPINPGNYPNADNACSLKFKHEEIFQKEKMFVESIEMRRNIALSLYSTVSLLLKEKRYEEAAKVTENLVALMPGNPDAMALHAYALAGIGDISAAQELCRSALSINPGHREASAFLKQYPDKK